MNNYNTELVTRRAHFLVYTMGSQSAYVCLGVGRSRDHDEPLSGRRMQAKKDGS